MDTNNKDVGVIRRLVIIFRRRWKIFLIVWAIVAGYVTYDTFTSPKMYKPQASIEIRPETPLIGGRDSEESAYVSGRGMFDTYYRTQESILTSTSLMEAVIKALPEDLRKNYEGNPDGPATLASRIVVEKVPQSFLLRIGVVGEDPVESTLVVNTIVSVYLDDVSKRLSSVKSSVLEMLSKQTLPEIQTQVTAADNAVRKFLEDSKYVNVEENFKALQEYWKKIDDRLVVLRLERAKVGSELKSMETYQVDGSKDQIIYHPVFQANVNFVKLESERSKILQEMFGLSLQYKSGHPQVKRLQAELGYLERKIKDALEGTLLAHKATLDAMRQEEDALLKEQDRLSKEITNVGIKNSQFQQLMYERTSKQDMYAAYLKKQDETTATAKTGLASVRIIDVAKVPKLPFKPRVFFNLMLGTMLGILLGFGAMLATDQLDNRILSPDEIEAFVGIEVLAAIPMLEQGKEAGERPVLLSKEASLDEFEAFRGLRAQVVTRLEKIPGAKVVAVISALQSEGKTTVVANLARVLAMEGRRVLIFDADMRRPSIRPLFVGEAGPGLELILSGQATFEQTVRTSKIPGVDVLGVSQGTSGAAELASSPRFAATLKEARDKYDIVILDMAPVLQVSESPLIARFADATVLVVREGQTNRGAAQAAKKRLSTMEVKILGAVLNCAVRHSFGYGYGYRYYSYYYGPRRHHKA